MFFLTPISLIAFVFYYASIGGFGEMPDLEVLENPKTNLASEIISSDGKTLGKYYFNDNRTPVTFDELPSHLVDALIATEDIRFYSHSGIDFKRTFGAALKFGQDGGGSTITQQLAKLLFTGEGSRDILERLTQKFKEYIIAVRLERHYTKDEIITQYLNLYDFGNNGDGIRSAARIYFGKEPIDLDINESAILVGMLKNSSLYNPRPHRNPVGVKNRRNVVLGQMKKYNYLEQVIVDLIQLQPLNLNYTPESHREGLATYFREFLRAHMKTWINDEIISLYAELFKQGFVQTVECRIGEELVGGLYGISLKGAFFGESMFSRETDASKIALIHLVARLNEDGFSLLDTQFTTDHLISLGAIEISRNDYLAKLNKALSKLKKHVNKALGELSKALSKALNEVLIKLTMALDKLTEALIHLGNTFRRQ